MLDRTLFFFERESKADLGSKSDGTGQGLDGLLSAIGSFEFIVVFDGLVLLILLAE